MLGSAGGQPQGERLAVVSTVFSFTEIFELATRLLMSPAGSETTHIDIGLHGLAGRHLWIDEAKRAGFLRPHKTSMPDFNFKREYSRGELVASAWSLALEPATELFRRFGWDPPREILQEMQEELRSFRRSAGT